MPDLPTDEGRKQLDKIIEAQQPDVVILDSLSTLVRSGIENEAESWAPIQDWLMAHRWKGRAMILLHHEGVSGRPRGSTKREDVLDSMIGLKQRSLSASDESEGERRSHYDLSFTKHRDFFGEDAAPRVLHLSSQTGEVKWQWEFATDEVRTKVRQMLKAGMKQRDIAKHLGVTEGRVSQIKAEHDTLN